MILHTITPRSALSPALCGHAPQLIEARGRIQADPRLIGMPARQFHVECPQCALATPPYYSARTAEAIWNLARSRDDLTALSDLPALRLRAERALAMGIGAAA